MAHSKPPHERVLTEAEARCELARRSVPAPETGLLGVEEIAARANVSPEVVRQWLSRGELLGWRGGISGTIRLPPEQLDQEGRPYHGLAKVLAEFDGDAFRAWDWLTCPIVATHGEPPLSLLVRGEVAEVVRLARGHFMGTFD